MSAANWQFFIDVGGTFTDVVARRPDGEVVTHKLLSSGVVRGVAEESSNAGCIRDPRRVGEPPDFWTGYEVLRVGSCEQSTTEPGRSSRARVSRFDAGSGELFLETPVEEFGSGALAYELRSREEAPVLAIRYLMGRRLSDPVGPVDVRLGTTRATNALLERKGAKTVLVTTRGFGDVLKIGYQDRPALFDLNIRKRDELTAAAVEVDERLSAAGEVLHELNDDQVRRQLEHTKADGIEALAICLLHSHVNPIHEEKVASIAEAVGFSHVSVSSRLSRLERIVSRGDTTVVDAYLSGVIRAYVASLRRSMPEARIRLMTSAGGLIDAGVASAKDTILSGPAGGVVGCAHVTRQAGFPRAIGFDMGGTSTDVSRIELPPGGFEYTHETVKAGVRIMTPMLAVETVAAGGGSICAFDGQKLSVGPLSAGADPGPACYGRGGPLTVTDVNLFLGRVVPEHFPFRLDRAVVEQKLTELCAEVNAATESSLIPIGLAEGFIKIANANMAAAIKKISIAKGYDASDYVLTTFGGAGGQHACSIARALGMSRVLCSPHAGILSAVGIGVADVKRIGQRSVCETLGPETMRTLDATFRSIEDDLGRAMAREGVASSALAPPVRTMELCYAGQATLITVSAVTYDEARDEFEARHRRAYGYCHEGRSIEIRVVRAELTARSKHPAMGKPPRQSQDTESRQRTTEMVVDGGRRPVPLYLRSDLTSSTRVTGPAIIIEDTSTIVVEPGWEAAVTAAGDVVLTDRHAVPRRERVSAEVDPVQLELFNNQFAAVAEQMGTTLRRTALSTNVKERLDFSCAVFTPSGDLVVNAPHIPVHLGGMSDCIKSLIEDVARFNPGDVYVTNDPYRGGSHLNDVTVITPVHNEGGERLLFFVASRAHHAEIGGTRPGSMPPDSTCLAQEGVLISAFPLVRGGQPHSDRLLALLSASPYPSRAPEDNLADVTAQVAANQRGVCDLKAMIDRYGLDVVHGYMRHIQVAAENKTRAALTRLPDGTHSFEDCLDDGSPIRLSVTIRGDRAVFDFTGTGPVLPGNLNANRAIVTSAVLYCLRCLIDEDIPLNGGVLAPIEIILPECLLNPPRSADPGRCPAVAGGNVETSQRVVDCIFGALKTVAAGQGTMNNVAVGNDRFGYYETICGGAGAGPGFAGADAVHTNMTNTRMTDPEVLESRYPLRLIRFAVRHGSGGAGEYRGGCGVIRELEFLEALEVSIISQRRTVAPYGIAGGGDGARGVNRLRRVDSENDELLPSVARIEVVRGDRLTIETPGGGGWGPERGET